MIIITAHWTNDEYKVQSTLIAIRELNGDHDGENISEIVHLVAKEFEFVDRIGYFVGDNATNNDTAMECLDRHIREEGEILLLIDEFFERYTATDHTEHSICRSSRHRYRCSTRRWRTGSRSLIQRY